MRQYTSDSGNRHTVSHFAVLFGVVFSLGLHASAVCWWMLREKPPTVKLGMQEVTVEIIAPPAPIVEPAPPAPAPPPPPIPEIRDDEMAEQRKVVKKKKLPVLPRPQPPIAQPVKPVENPVAKPAAVAVTQARYDADYLNNPKPAYPALSNRLGEEGRVLLRVKVSAEGKPLEVSVKTSSGFSRLDEAAVKATYKWRFVPARQGDVALTSWVEVPIQFGLKK